MNMSNNNEKEINKNNENADKEVNECSDITDDNQNYSRKQTKTYVCSVNDCGKVYRNELSYKEHSRQSHSEKTMRCDHPECDYMTADIKLLKSHSLLHSDERQFTCSIENCGKTFKKESGLSRHQISHTLKPIQCTREGCDQTFKTEVYLKRHIVYKHSSTEKVYFCRTCGKCFDTVKKRRYHQRVVHQKVDQPIICRIDKCNREFKNGYHYSKHTQVFHSGQQFRCDHSGCDYITDKRNLISIHAKKHLLFQNNLFVCGIDGCVKAYKYLTNLNSHKKNHISERILCKVFGCKKIFRYQEHLNRHMKLVHSIQYKCSSVGCDLAFMSISQYKAHLRHCHNKQSFSCPQLDCHYTTDYKGNLKCHLKRHSNERLFVCNTDGCGKAFKRNNALKNHQSIHIKTLEENSNSKINKGENKFLKTNFENCTKLFLSDLSKQSETDPDRSHSPESESNQSIPLTITDFNNTFESNENIFDGESKTQIVLIDNSVDHKDKTHYRCVWPGCQFGTDQTDLSETHRLVKIGETSYACHRPGCNYECNDRIGFIKHIKSHKPKTVIVFENQ